MKSKTLEDLDYEENLIIKDEKNKLNEMNMEMNKFLEVSKLWCIRMA